MKKLNIRLKRRYAGMVFALIEKKLFSY